MAKSIDSVAVIPMNSNKTNIIRNPEPVSFNLTAIADVGSGIIF